MADQIITKEQCKKILSKWKNTENVSVTSFSSLPIDNQLDGLVGDQFYLKITYQENEKQNDIKLFVKTLSKGNEIMYKIAREIQAYEKEEFFYNIYIPAVQNYNLECDYLAKSYLCEPFSIVLEDLSQLSYRGFGKTGYLDLDHCYVCLKALARFHADGILYELLKSKDLSKNYKLQDEFSDILDENFFNKDSILYKYFYYSSEGILDVASLLPENGVKLEDFKTAVRSVLEDVGNVDYIRKDFRLTVTHNDLWTNNFLYKYDESNKVKSCKIIDFQTLSLRPPGFDVVGFLLLNTRKKFRDSYFTDLLKFYYKYFSQFIIEKGFNPTEVLSEDEFYTSCDFLMIPAKLHSTIDRSLTLIPEEIFAQESKSQETFRNFIFEGRAKYILDTFNKNDSFKDIMTEDIMELRSLLFTI